MRARTSADSGRSWSKDIIVRDDAGMSDLGYPRTVVLHDGKALTVYYLNEGAETDRYIAGTLMTFEGVKP
jgi:hypothetical protein